MVGDIHGCLDELRDLVRLIPDQYQILFLGDLIDRGPNSPGVVEFVYKLCKSGRARAVRGNHDENMLRYLTRDQRSGTNAMRAPHPIRLAEWNAIAAHPEWIEWLQSLPSYIEFRPNFFAVHAGALTTQPVATQKPNNHTNLRYVDLVDNNKVRHMNEKFEQPEGSAYWVDVYRAPNTVFYGHHVHSMEKPHTKYHHFLPDGNAHYTCGVDTGCVYGGKLSAVLVPEVAPFSPTFISVPSRRTYWNNHLLCQAI